MSALEPGLVISTSGRFSQVQADSGHEVSCHARGKKSLTVVGDRVLWRAAHDEGIIEDVLPRKNLLYRQDATRSKSFAANLDQVVVFLAAEPVFSEHLLARALIACKQANIPAIIVLNKADLQAPFDLAWARLESYRQMHYPVFALSALATTPAFEALIHALRMKLDRRISLIMGPSGSGKSSLINRLIPKAQAATAELSRALRAGRHTTTRSNWYWLDADKKGALIDSPGFQQFGLHHIDASALAGLMPDIGRHAAQCRFYNCTHMHEPGCAVSAHVGSQTQASGTCITPTRYAIYRDLFEQLKAAKP